MSGGGGGGRLKSSVCVCGGGGHVNLHEASRGSPLTLTFQRGRVMFKLFQ